METQYTMLGFENKTLGQALTLIVLHFTCSKETHKKHKFNTVIRFVLSFELIRIKRLGIINKSLSSGILKLMAFLWRKLKFSRSLFCLANEVDTLLLLFLS